MQVEISRGSVASSSGAVTWDAGIVIAPSSYPIGFIGPRSSDFTRPRRDLPLLPTSQSYAARAGKPVQSPEIANIAVSRNAKRTPTFWGRLFFGSLGSAMCLAIAGVTTSAYFLRIGVAATTLLAALSLVFWMEAARRDRKAARSR